MADRKAHPHIKHERAFRKPDAKKDAADSGGPQLQRLDAEIDERLGRAALAAR